MADHDSAHLHHGFDYLEIPVLDIDAAVEFYGAAFGWTFTSYGPGYQGITTPDGREAGGLSLTGMVKPGGILVVLFSRDLSATRDAVRAAGGIITRDIFEFPGGYRFHFTEPSGHELGVWSFNA
ncbi:VOC family protein [Demequina sp. NBRC 110052]|uniref:VOC family protein n=1 Tax=Demequina sp. NBRC 110052 TaxID=1570341 RepID=UPI000A0231B3|nr:VOC family protein [Demequina sp. NBRC 110052]